jgi:hypothetical protein
MKPRSLDYMHSAIDQWQTKYVYYKALALADVTSKSNGEFVTDQYGLTHDRIKLNHTANYCYEQLTWWQERLREAQALAAQALEVLPSSFKQSRPLDTTGTECPTSNHDSEKLTVSSRPIKNIKS